MNGATQGGIDCDLHPAAPTVTDLLPYLEPLWRDMIARRGIDAPASIAYPAAAPISVRPDWRPADKSAAATFPRLRAEALDAFGTRLGICNCLIGVPLLFGEDMAAAFARATNDWIAREWLDREPRLRASIVVPVQNPGLAAAEIDRCAADRRFVQVLLPANGELPLGRRAHWPIYEAAVRHGLPVGIHAGSAYRHPVTNVGWPSYYAEDYASHATSFQSQLLSLVAEGVFAKFPSLCVVLIESGFTWLPAFVWRLEKFWRGLRMEVPWVSRPPGEIVREHVRLTLQPIDAPDPATLARVVEQLGSDRLLLFSTDYPHWQFEGAAALPEGLAPGLARRILVDNAIETYPRLMEDGP
ncbi:MAG TPA: amidohydrolase family protein [Acetobacteraceae bacterium]|nr:amidohydrolase family protein [Acetobacteraceae bacterium]